MSSVAVSAALSMCSASRYGQLWCSTTQTQPLAPHLFLGMLSLSVPHSSHAQALYVQKDSARTQSKKWTDDGHVEDGISWHLKIWGIKQCPREAADACCEPKWGENFIPYIKTFPTGHTVLIAYLHISFSDYQWNIFSMYMKNTTDCQFDCSSYWVTILFFSKLLTEKGWGDT